MDRSTWKPRDDRFAACLNATITNFAGESVAGKVLNISPGGFFAECETPLLIGSQIVIFIPGLGRLPAQVRWALGNRVGAVFNGILNGPLQLGLEKLLQSEAKRGIQP